MNAIVRYCSCLIIMLLIAACQSTGAKGSAGDNYREDQASRQTQRDLEDADKAKSKRPIDTHRSAGQDVIDQPR